MIAASKQCSERKCEARKYGDKKQYSDQTHLSAPSCPGHCNVMRVEGTAARVVVIAVMLALAGVFFSLGRWQWQRAAESRALLERFASRAAEPALMQAADDSAIDALRYRRLRLRGSYESRVQFLLDNSVDGGEVGYQVLTPFRAVGTERWLLVNRGWVKADPDRRVLPDVPVDATLRDLSGRIDTLPRPGLVLADSSIARERQGVLVVSYPAAAQLAAYLGHATFGYQVLLDAMEPNGYRRDWQAAGLAPERHLAYAGQWFLFALGAAAVALVTGVRMMRVGPRS